MPVLLIGFIYVDNEHVVFYKDMMENGFFRMWLTICMAVVFTGGTSGSEPSQKEVDSASKAIERAEAVLERDSAKPQRVARALLDRAEAYEVIGEFGKALNDYERASGLDGVTDKQRLDARLGFASACFKLGDKQRALPVINTILDTPGLSGKVKRDVERLRGEAGKDIPSASRPSGETGVAGDGIKPARPASGELSDGIDLQEQKKEVDTQRERLATCVIPLISWGNISVEQCVSDLRTQIARQNPGVAHGGILIATGELSEVKTDGGGTLAQRKVQQIHLANAPVRDVLKVMCEQAGLYCHVGPRGVSILPDADDTGHQYVRSYRMTKGFYEQVEASLEPHDGRQTGIRERKPLQQLFKEAGCPFPPGAIMTYHPGKSLLIIRNTSRNLAFCEDLLMDMAEGSPHY